ncbi:MAG: FAD-dependent oxidoreductase [Cyanobacteria bacterium J06631_6]
MKSRTYAVVGGGASGIAAAHYLQQQGIAVELIEMGERLGGRIATQTMGERQMAMGGKNIGKGYRLFREFTAAMGDNPYEFFGLNSSQVRNGKIVTLDGGQRWLGILKLLGSFAPLDLLRFLRMCLAIKLDGTNGYLGGKYFSSAIAKSGDVLLSDHFGKAVCQRLIRPMSVRMNGAEPDEIYLGNLGSNLRMVLDSYEQLNKGIEPVLEQFAKKVAVRLQTRVESLIVKGDRLVGLEMVDGDDNVQQQEYAGIILATPASVTAKLIAPHNEELGNALAQVKYYPVAVIVAEYKRNIFSEQVRALVFDSSEPISNAGCYGVNDRHIVRYTFSGRAARPYLEANTEPEELLSMAEKSLNRYIRVDASDRVQFVAQPMSLGLCAYTHDYPKFSRRLHAQLDKIQGMELAGDYLRGASIEACFQSGLESVERILAANSLPAASKTQDNLVSV